MDGGVHDEVLPACDGSGFMVVGPLSPRMADTKAQQLAEEFDADIGDELPETLDRAAVERMRIVARLLDNSIPIPGTPFSIGIDPILSVVPVGGDLAGGVLSMYIVAEAARLGVSYRTLLKMLANVSVDAVAGSVPVLGTVFDAFWKANKRNMRLFLEEFDEAEGRPREDPLTIEVD